MAKKHGNRRAKHDQPFSANSAPCQIAIRFCTLPLRRGSPLALSIGAARLNNRLVTFDLFLFRMNRRPPWQKLTPPQDAEPKKKKSKMPMILGVVLALVLGGGGFYATYSGLILRIARRG